ncbi:hypothetical protein [Streptomyces griseoluteus]
MTPPPAGVTRTVLKRYNAGHPRGSWPAEGYAAEKRRQGIPARVVMDWDSGDYLVIEERAS